MNPDVFKKIFENSESKNIDVWCDGKLAIQFHCTPTKVTDECNGTLSVENKANGNVAYINTYHISTIWVGRGKEEKKEYDIFI